MSVVTNVILKVPFFDGKDGAVGKINAELIKYSKQQLFVDKPIDHAYEENPPIGGTKCLEVELYLAAFNYMDTQVLVDAVKKVAKESDQPNGYQLFVCEQEWDNFKEMLGNNS
jgi:hypothetical protein